MVIKNNPPVFGIRYWAAWYEGKQPRFEVFRYAGFGTDGRHYFQSTKNASLVGFKEGELLGLYFRPFLINTEKLYAAA